MFAESDLPLFLWRNNGADYHIIPGIGKLPLAALKKSDLEKFYAEQMKSGNLDRNGVGDKKLSGAVIRSMHTRIRCALDQALKEGLVNRNKAVGCKLSPKKKEIEVLSHEEIARLLIQVKEEGFYELILLGLATGMRRGELLGLKWDDINPCQNRGTKTHTDLIRMEDVRIYLSRSDAERQRELPTGQFNAHPVKSHRKCENLPQRELREEETDDYMLCLEEWAILPDDFSVAQVVSLTGICEKRILRWLQTGELFAVRFGGRYHIPKEVVIEWYAKTRYTL